jgi:hypothetical protein
VSQRVVTIGALGDVGDDDSSGAPLDSAEDMSQSDVSSEDVDSSADVDSSTDLDTSSSGDVTSSYGASLTTGASSSTGGALVMTNGQLATWCVVGFVGAFAVVFGYRAIRDY